MAELNLGGIWSATVDAVRRERDLLLPVAGLLVFLPRLVMSRLIGDTPPDQLMSEGQAGQTLLLLLPFVCIWVYAQLVVILLFMGKSGRDITVGDGLRLALAVLVPAIVASLMQGMAVFFGLLFLILPGFYLMARLSLVMPVLLDRVQNPIDALRESWRLTSGNGFRILFILLMLFSGLLLIGIVLGGLASAFGFVANVAAGTPAQGWGVGRWLFETIGAGVETALSIYFLGFIAMLYQVLVRASRQVR